MDENKQNKMNKGDKNVNTKIKRYCPVTESLEESLKEMKAIREGKMPKKLGMIY